MTSQLDHGPQDLGASSLREDRATHERSLVSQSPPAVGVPLRVLSLFAGIGGFDLGLERTGGFKTVAFCEIDPFCRRVLAKHWPEVPCYHDVRELTAAKLSSDGISADVICGGFPCQDLSTAGKQGGIAAERSGLWSEIVRLACEIRPRFIIVENVAALLNGPSKQPGGWFGKVLGDLAECGYDAEWRNIPAWLVGLPHGRERVWLVAYPEQERWAGILPHFIDEHEAAGFGDHQAAVALAASRDLGERARGRVRGESPFFDGAYGLSEIVGGLGAGGNAVAPDIAELIGRAIFSAIAIEAPSGVETGNTDSTEGESADPKGIARKEAA